MESASKRVPNLTIRYAGPKDVPVILSLIKKLADYERLSHEVVADEQTLKESLFGERKVAEALLGCIDEAPVGFALFFHNFSTFLGRPGLYLEDLYVEPEFRGRGLGEKLLRKLARIATERGCGRLEWSVLDWNEPAIRFYEKLGAVAMEGWTVYRATGKALDRLAEGNATT
jgi:GNAT superfamily N-acetyltransferase